MNGSQGMPGYELPIEPGFEATVAAHTAAIAALDARARRN